VDQIEEAQPAAGFGQQNQNVFSTNSLGNIFGNKESNATPRKGGLFDKPGEVVQLDKEPKEDQKVDTGLN